MDEVGDDVRGAERWENVALDDESDDESDEESHEESDGESHEESGVSDQVVRDGFAQLQAGKKNLKRVVLDVLCRRPCVIISIPDPPLLAAACAAAGSATRAPRRYRRRSRATRR